jgi:GMP synthase (glutamine-hydrolysing)
MTLKTLVLNNYLNYAEVNVLLKAINPYTEYTVSSFRDVIKVYEAVKDVDAIILTGSEARLVKPEGAMYNDVSRIVIDSERPVLGICFGHQLGCMAFGAEVSCLENTVKDTFEAVTIVETDDIFYGFKRTEPALFVEHHNDYVKQASLENAGLQLLAFSQSCETEAVKHRSKPFYGTQFHAEEVKIGSEEHMEGLRVLENFYRFCCKR